MRVALKSGGRWDVTYEEAFVTSTWHLTDQSTSILRTRNNYYHAGPWLRSSGRPLHQMVLNYRRHIITNTDRMPYGTFFVLRITLWKWKIRFHYQIIELWRASSASEALIKHTVYLAPVCTLLLQSVWMSERCRNLYIMTWIINKLCLPLRSE